MQHAKHAIMWVDTPNTRSLVGASCGSSAGLLITAALLLAPSSALQLFQTNAEMMPYAKTYCVIRYASGSLLRPSDALLGITPHARCL